MTKHVSEEVAEGALSARQHDSVTWQVASAPSVPRPGYRLGPYELLAPIGQGGMATVWAARDLRVEHDAPLVAVKTILPLLASDPRFKKMFITEARLASHVSDEHVCRVLDFGQASGELFLAMEWIDGDSLAALRGENKCLPYGVAVRIAHDVALGLHAAHVARDESGVPLGIVHRDVSPQNVLLTRSGQAKVADFGVAKATQSSAPATQSGYIKGKVDYLAPEQAFSEPVDARADVFALGVVLYEMTCGERPFAGASQMATLVRLTSPEPARPIAEIVEGYPEALAAVVTKALEKDKQQRFANMAELALALEQALLELESSSHADVAAYLKLHDGARLREHDQVIHRALEARAPSSFVKWSAADGESRALSAAARATSPARSGRRILPWALGVIVVIVLLVAAAYWEVARRQPSLANHRHRLLD